MNSRSSKNPQRRRHRTVFAPNQSKPCQNNLQSTKFSQNLSSQIYDEQNPSNNTGQNLKSKIAKEYSSSSFDDAAEAISKLDFRSQVEDNKKTDVKIEESRGLAEESRGLAEESSSSCSLDSTAEASRRLNELNSCSAIVEISEEQMLVNDQLQEDELMALEAIFGDNIFIFEKMDDLRTFQVQIHLELPDDFNVCAEFHSSPENLRSETKNDCDNVLHAFKVQHLPPIILTCLLPPSYPSDYPPHFILHVEWLDSIEVSKLCSMLDNIWSEQPGEEVLYRWVEWLLSSSLSFLEFENGVRLNLSHMVVDKGDTRVISRSVSVEAEIHSLMEYNVERCNEVFLAELHQCVICYSEYPGINFIKLPCGHFYCCKCIETYSNIHVKEGTVTKLLCPNTKCGGFIPHSVLRKLLGDESYNRWDSLMLDKTLASMSDVVYCPRCETACLEDEENNAQCTKCFFSFCSVCRERRHVGERCVDPQVKLQILQKRQNNPNLKEDQRREELGMIHDIISVKKILEDAKQCPTCKMAISRTEGCNKMICRECGQFFCYNCNKAINGYDHFRNGECKLFPPEEIQRWGEIVNLDQQVARIRAELNPQHAVQCPSCRQLSARVGNNNHIGCWSCRCHFCAQCRQIVKRSSQHYGPKGCKQHSVNT